MMASVFKCSPSNSPPFALSTLYSPHGNHTALSATPAFGSLILPKQLIRRAFPSCCLNYDRYHNGDASDAHESMRRSFLFILASSGLLWTSSCCAKTKGKSPYDERRILEQNKRIQRENNAPDDFPSFVREGFQVNVLTSENYITRESGLIVRDYEVGQGDCPTDGQQVTFHYVGYNESGRRIDSTYIQGAPAKIRMGTKGLVPGFEEGIRDMRPGGKRRIIIPPELGPPEFEQVLEQGHLDRSLLRFPEVVHDRGTPGVGPSTFFSAKQFEVFDVELLSIQSCQRRTIGFYSDVVCD